jgi:hypothetical protein
VAAASSGQFRGDIGSSVIRCLIEASAMQERRRVDEAEQSHKPHPPNRCALVPLDPSRQSEISGHGFPPQLRLSGIFAAQSGEIALQASFAFAFSPDPQPATAPARRIVD